MPISATCGGYDQRHWLAGPAALFRRAGITLGAVGAIGGVTDGGLEEFGGITQGDTAFAIWRATIGLAVGPAINDDDIFPRPLNLDVLFAQDRARFVESDQI